MPATRGSGNHRDMHHVFISGSVDLMAAAHPGVTTASLLPPTPLPPHTHTNTVPLCAPVGGSLFPNCKACFCSILGSASAPHPLLSDPETKPVESIGPGREL